MDTINKVAPRYSKLGALIGALMTVLLFTGCATHPQAQAVHVQVGVVSIPTYKLDPPDPNPPFPLVSKSAVYPYTMLNDLTNDRVPVRYHAIHLENKYLKVTILPQLGGHTYIYDKVDHRNVLYRDPVIKYGLVGPRGAWIPGGMEFNFPSDHTTATVSPVESKVVHDADGSATAYIGLLDRVSNMYWQIALTLQPNTARLKEGITLFNSTASSHLYKYYTNTAVKATPEMQWIYPMREVVFDDAFSKVESWPVWHGVNRSWYKNVPSAVALFGWDVHRNFYGVYYHNTNYGVVHVGNYREDPGKKVWTWGTAPSGTIWEKILSDGHTPYSEIQSGRFYTQGSSQFMNPGRVEHWTEYWYPVRGLDGGFVQATRQMAINIVWPKADTPTIKLAVGSVVAVHDVTIIVKDGVGGKSKVLKRVADVNLKPMQTALYTIPVRSCAQACRNLYVEIQNEHGKTLLHWSAAEPVDGNAHLAPRVGEALKERVAIGPHTPIEQLYLHGLFQQKTRDWRGAAATYAQVLQRDPGYIPALLRDAWRDYHAAEFGKAAALLARATVRDNDTHSDPNLPYAIGVVDRAEGKLARARDAFWAAIHYGSSSELGPSEVAPLVELGEIAIQQHRYPRAVRLLKRVVARAPDNAMAMADLSVAYRLEGNRRQAKRVVREALECMPLLPYAMAERWQDEGAPVGSGKWAKIMGSDPDAYLAVAAWYQRLGAWMSADGVLDTAVKSISTRHLSPMLYYYLAFDADQEGHSHAAARLWSKAASLPVQEVFPNRLMDVAVLDAAINHNGSDVHAQYALGNFLFAHGRYTAAAHLWQQARRGGFHNPVLFRNLAVYEWHVKHDLSKAASFYRQAIHLNPDGYRLYVHLDEVYAEQGRKARRAALFRSAPATVLAQDTVRARQAVFLLESSQPAAALRPLMHHTFKPWEGGKVIHQIYVAANMELGKAALAAGKPEQAIRDFRKAELYPVELGTGRPASPDLSEQQYWLGNAMRALGRAAAANLEWMRAAKGESVYAALASKKLHRDAAAARILAAKVAAANRPNASAADNIAAAMAERFSGNVLTATKYFKRALILEPMAWQARIGLQELAHPVGNNNG